MKKEKIYILHENGANSHYKALDYLCHTKHTKLIYREFSVFKLIIKSLIRRDLNLLKKQVKNIYFLISLLFSKNKKIVLGIAPYDFRLLLNFILKKHQIYYHTSWTCWDKSFYPKRVLVNKKLIFFWEKFLKNRSNYIFAVSSETKNQLVKNLGIDPNKIKVVYHSFDDNIFKPKDNFLMDLKFIYVGRLERQKGVIELLAYFSKYQEIKFTIVGEGSLKNIVKEYSQKYQNIEYIGYINNENKLASLYKEHTFLVLNSKKTKEWEELFGMVIIEAMACGVIPLTTNHKGPLEIIKNNENGFIFDEYKYINGLDYICNKFKTNKHYFMKIRKNAIIRAKEFSIKSISKRWEVIFE